ncbi:MAG: C40 family peptidase [Desulfovibrio sp.]|jgi:cell wall-associated NlpC family hydrolase|nr:C40 family peptidase [Desulfovibrio sp.]
MKNYFITLLFALLLSSCGFLKSSDTDITPPLAHKVVNAAYSQIGKSYQSGGKSPQTGFDCSGLVWWAYQKNGLAVPRRTVEQARAGVAVPRGNARPGDIVVFRASRAINGLHTGLYAGNSTFIHSPRTGSRVRAENMDRPCWSSNLLTVRRVVR